MKAARNLSFRVWLALVLVSAFSCLTAGVLSAYILIASFKADLKTSIKAFTGSLVDVAFVDLTKEREQARLPSIIQSSMGVSRFGQIIRIFDEAGRLIYSNLPGGRVEALDVAMLTPDYDEPEEIDVLGRSHFVIQRDYHLLSKEKRTAQVAVPLPRITEAIRDSKAKYPIVFSLLMIFSLLVARFFVFRLIAPVKSIAKHLKDLANLEVKQWAPVPQVGDGQFLGEIISATNSLIAQVQQSNLANQHLARYVAHEIRTPLTMMLGEVETSQDLPMVPELQKMLRQFSKDILHIDLIVKTILELANRGRKESAYSPRAVDILETIKKCVSLFEKTFERSVILNLPPKFHPKALIDPDLLNIVMDNLLRNSVKHGGPRVTQSITLSDVGTDAIEISIEDTGDGLPLSILGVVNSKDVDSPGLGIGLTLCREVCFITGWEVKFENLPKKGLRVSIRIPAAISTPELAGLTNLAQAEEARGLAQDAKEYHHPRG